MRVPGAAYLIVSAILFTTGAVGVLIRSIGTDHNRLPHTGNVDYLAEVPKIPAASSLPYCCILKRFLAEFRSHHGAQNTWASKRYYWNITLPHHCHSSWHLPTLYARLC